jgi:uncharacterized GH25 family protein
MRAVTVLILAVSCVVIQPVRAHDLWLVPDATYTLGKPALIRASSGMDFPKSIHAPDVAAYPRRLLVLPDGDKSTLEPAGTEGDAGLLRFTPSKPGLYLAAVETKPRIIKLSAEDFNAYLVSDGLPHIYHLRSKERTLDQPAVERYSKSPKVLLRVGNGPGDPLQVLGLPLEIVPLRDPFALKPGDTLGVRVLFQGKPLADANLGWDHPADGEPPSGTVRTNARGEALIPIAHTGLMTIRLTHMTRPKVKDYEWESFWTTLTFRVPGG